MVKENVTVKPKVTMPTYEIIGEEIHKADARHIWFV